MRVVPRQTPCEMLLGGLRPLGACLLVVTLLSACGTSGAEKGASLCPGTPAGIAVDPDGCPLYSDADAVPDYQDNCPDTGPGIPVDAKGCPLDSDTDGVADNDDACGGTPTGARVDARGCPLAGERIAIVTNINFDFDRAMVREDVRMRLSRVILLLKEMPEIDVQIVGYTDDIGSVEYNLALSLRRAEAVRDYMVARGIDGTRLGVAGRGNSEPIVSNGTPEGRAVNRRVEFVVR
jgi:OOP family OmpA-OmpF porin